MRCFLGEKASDPNTLFRNATDQMMVRDKRGYGDEPPPLGLGAELFLSCIHQNSVDRVGRVIAMFGVSYYKFEITNLFANRQLGLSLRFDCNAFHSAYVSPPLVEKQHSLVFGVFSHPKTWLKAAPGELPANYRARLLNGPDWEKAMFTNLMKVLGLLPKP